MKKYLLLACLCSLAACEQATEKTANVVITSTSVKLADSLKISDTIPAGAGEVIAVKAVKKKRKKSPTPYDPTTVNLFIPLAEKTKGKLYYAANANRIVKIIKQVVENHAEAGADIVFLLDKTSSMWDDIAAVQSSMQVLLATLEKFPDIQVSIAAYGDRESDGRDWFSCSPLSNDFKSLKTQVDQITLSGGGDYPESVYDGIYGVVDQIKWRSNTRRMILVLGDAPPLTDPKLTEFQEADVIKKCKLQGVEVNLYPVVVGF